ncbi:Na+/H+ antiporter family protein [Shouchella lehensis]|uniref:Amino acid transporter n=1 Tax=Shouchella lehensis G1 TaxID=1246626 RepID=A0A060M5X4_9BACI|nr:Na+/H+ antiporter NhaC family protein [Shouchella lehensis]AIC95479.1 amino acid transporter [Shouchella lehensis G1]
MNAVIIAVLLMIILSLARVHVVLAITLSALIGGLIGGLGFSDTVEIYGSGLGGNAEIAFSYVLLGAFAIGLSRTGLPDFLVDRLQLWMKRKGDSDRDTLTRMLLFLMLLVVACMSQNAVPVHIAFIPILIPPILLILNRLEVDRRLIACILTFGLTAPYMLLPYGFGQIFHKTIADNMEASGLSINIDLIPEAMLLPTISTFIGLLVAVFITYRQRRIYKDVPLSEENHDETKSYSVTSLSLAVFAVVVTVIVQSFYRDSMIPAALAGLLVLFVSGAVKVKKTDEVMSEGIKMMGFIGFVMLAAAGFAAVIRETGHVESLVTNVAGMINGNQVIAVLLMMVVGLIITLGIGSSFSTIPIITTLFVPLGLEVGLSTLAIISIIGSAGAIGDAGAPASDSTLGPTAGLNADGQHDHIWDTCVPTFLHLTVPLFFVGWIAALIL